MTRKQWTPEEDKALCEAYVKLAIAQYTGEKLSKAALTRELQAGPLAERSRGSIDASWMNCSAVAQKLNLLPGLPFGHVKGYKPAPNYRRQLEEILPAAVYDGIAGLDECQRIAIADRL